MYLFSLLYLCSFLSFSTIQTWGTLKIRCAHKIQRAKYHVGYDIPWAPTVCGHPWAWDYDVKFSETFKGEGGGGGYAVTFLVISETAYCLVAR